MNKGKGKNKEEGNGEFFFALFLCLCFVSRVKRKRGNVLKSSKRLIWIIGKNRFKSVLFTIR